MKVQRFVGTHLINKCSNDVNYSEPYNFDVAYFLVITPVILLHQIIVLYCTIIILKKIF